MGFILFFITKQYYCDAVMHIESCEQPIFHSLHDGQPWANDMKDRPSHQEGQILSQAGGKTHMQLGPKSEVALIGWQIHFCFPWQSVADDAM